MLKITYFGSNTGVNSLILMDTANIFKTFRVIGLKYDIILKNNMYYVYRRKSQ